MPPRKLTLLMLTAAAMFAQGPSICTYLELTSDQRATIDRRAAEQASWLTSMRPRQALANAEVAREAAASPLDPQSLGARHVAVLTLQREVVVRERDLVAANRALLSDSQRARLQVLEEARRLSPTIDSGTSLFILPAPPCETRLTASRWFDTSTFQSTAEARLGTGCAVPGVAFAGVSDNPFFGPAWPSLQAYLVLTAEQFAKLAENSRVHEQWARERSVRVNQVQFEIFEESAKEVLDALALGLRFAEIEAIRREIEERQGLLVETNQKVLTPGQRAKFDQLLQAAKFLPAVNEARGVNLMKAECPLSLSGTFPPIGATACGYPIFTPQ